MNSTPKPNYHLTTSADVQLCASCASDTENNRVRPPGTRWQGPAHIYFSSTCTTGRANFPTSFVHETSVTSWPACRTLTTPVGYRIGWLSLLQRAGERWHRPASLSQRQLIRPNSQQRPGLNLGGRLAKQETFLPVTTACRRPLSQAIRENWLIPAWRDASGHKKASANTLTQPKRHEQVLSAPGTDTMAARLDANRVASGKTKDTKVLVAAYCLHQAWPSAQGQHSETYQAKAEACG